MDYLVISLIGFVGGATLVFFILEKKRRQAAKDVREAEELRSRNLITSDELRNRQNQLAELEARLNGERSEYEQRAISYGELQQENGILRQDLRNLDVYVRKLEYDHRLQQDEVSANEVRVEQICQRYLKDTIKWISRSLNQNNFVQCKQRLLDTIERCRGVGFEIPESEEAGYISDLRSEFEAAVRAALEREEQARIKAQIREEREREKAIERELKQLERERLAIEAALRKALEEAEDEHSQEVQDLKRRLAEAEAKSQRAISQAQLTRAGHVYVISNLGAFGENVYKIGMTRRLEPIDRVKELSSASVPFPFDVHMMLSSDDAPALENALHRALHKTRINRVNVRKEFFRTDLETICRLVREHHGEVEYIADVEALEYRQSLEMTGDDQEFIEHIYEEWAEEHPALADDE